MSSDIFLLHRCQLFLYTFTYSKRDLTYPNAKSLFCSYLINLLQLRLQHL